jgi:quercetin dioxygenase-like cupin family protein
MLQVQRWDARRDGVLVASRLRQRLEAQGLWVTESRHLPGSSLCRPRADHDVLQIVLTGLLKVTIDGNSTILGAGDTLFVPRGAGCVLDALGTTPAVVYSAAFLAHGPRIVHAPQVAFLEAVWR